MSKIKVENNPYLNRGIGLFSQTGLSTPIVNTTDELTLIDGGVGTLTVPANGFKVGDTFWAYMGGNISSVNGDTLRLRVKTLSGVTLADTGAITMRNATNKPFTIDFKFSIWTIGGAGIASILTGGLFQYLENASDKFDSYPSGSVNNTTFDTTTAQTLDITAEWGTASASNSIQTSIFYLTQVYG